MFGEDVGKIGDVNQGWRVCKKYGKLEFRHGIRESTIIGQGIGLATWTSSNSRDPIFGLYSLLLTNIK